MGNKNFREIKIKRTNPNNVSPIHVNDMVSSHDDKEFYIQFFEMEPPTFLEKEEIDKIEYIEAVMKVKLVMSPEFCEAMVKALNENIEKFKLAKKLIND